MTSLPRDIAVQFPGQFDVSVATRYSALWENNPYVKDHFSPDAIPPKRGLVVPLQYTKMLLDSQKRPGHFLPAWADAFNYHMRIGLRPSLPYPDLHLSPTEAAEPILSGRYWVVISGGKHDAPVKVWSRRGMQTVVDRLTEHGIRCVQIGSTSEANFHHELTGVVNLLGRTNLRQMVRTIAGAEGVICGITAAMHMAAAFQKPCVVVAGGREMWWWEAYVRNNPGFPPGLGDKLRMQHRYLHTIGELSCCQTRGCWKAVVTQSPGNKRPVCKLPVIVPGENPLPKCMQLIEPAEVVDAVLSYYVEGLLPPISTDSPEVVVLHPDVAAKQPGVPQRGPKGGSPSPLPHPATVLVRPLRPAAPKSSPLRQVVTAGPRVNAPLEDKVFDHPNVGGKFTVFVLMYGPDEYHDMQVRCVNAICDTVPAGRLDLRVGSNALNPKSVAFVDDLVTRGVVTKHYRNEANRYKYPVMREMFRDTTLPIDTQWLLWFDDDSIADVRRDWLVSLANVMAVKCGPRGPHLIGAPAYHLPRRAMMSWVESRPWYRRRPWQNANQRPIDPRSAGEKAAIHMVGGGFWALRTSAILLADIPDADLGNNGGDVTIGAQIYQAGLGQTAFNSGKTFVRTSSFKRRGIQTFFPGDGPTHGIMRNHDGK